MANWPTFNPNVYGESPENARRNRAIQDLYEPGSTFKLVTASAAIEEHCSIRPTIIDVSAGLIRIGTASIDDMHRLRRAVVHRRASSSRATSARSRSARGSAPSG